MYGLAQVPVTERTMLEKDEALKPANMVTGRLGGRYVGRNRKWQGILPAALCCLPEAALAVLYLL